MKTIRTIAAALVALTATVVASNAAYMTKDEINALPSDKVATIKADCAKKWGDDFSMRLYCEDKQYEALKQLLERDGR
jgi:hypothetical protein